MTGAGIGLNVGVSNCCADWKRQIRILFLVGFLQRLSLVGNNIPDGRGVLIGHVALQFDRLPLLSLRGLFFVDMVLLRW